MSILIEGIEMPKRHLFEAFVAIGDGQIVVKDLEKNKLFEGKIEEVRTPHGRLIDADAFLEENKEFANRDFIHPKYECTLRDLIDSAPTIIDVEVSE